MENCMADYWRDSAWIFTQWALIASVLIGAGVYKMTGTTKHENH